MSTNSAIEWTDTTWNPVSGCTKVSPGCANCYIERTPPFRIGHRKFDEKGTTGIVLHPERLQDPRKWKRPRRVFVNSLSDLFHDQIPPEFIAEVFHTMAKCPHHIFQILTKRPANMKGFLADLLGVIRSISPDAAPFLPNVWLGVSVENQHFADERIPLLLQTPAAVRFISAEPLLGPVDLGGHFLDNRSGTWPALDWVICGGESGPDARPMNPDWARSLRDQCQAAGVKYFFKQWGEWTDYGHAGANEWRQTKPGFGTLHLGKPLFGGREFRSAYPWFKSEEYVGPCMVRIGKESAGRRLDGREWNEYPGACATK